MEPQGGSQAALCLLGAQGRARAGKGAAPGSNLTKENLRSSTSSQAPAELGGDRKGMADPLAADLEVWAFHISAFNKMLPRPGQAAVS